MKRFLAFSFLLLILSQMPRAMAQQNPFPATLSDEAWISLLTCSAGEPMYSAFGHSAVRVKDPKKGVDLVFNYGTFSFATPGFYLKFIRGQLDYFLSVSHFKNFYREYKREKRAIIEQKLQLSQGQAQSIYRFLVRNSMPENRYYRYNFFFDNCATRIRDIPAQSLEGSEFATAQGTAEKTFRDLLDEYMEGRRWWQFGINIVLGQLTDKPADAQDAAFLPDYLYLLFAQGKVKGKSLVSETRTLYQPETPIAMQGPWLTPDRLFWGIFILFVMLTLYEAKQKKYFRWPDATWFTLLAIAGLVISFLWWGTEHTVTVRNWNILWACPLHGIAGVALFAGKPARWARYYLLAAGGVALVVAGFQWALPQRLDPAFTPILLITALRGIRAFFSNRG